MGAKANSRSGRRYRRARRLRTSRRGVVAVIGTLLALLVFFALFGIFLTQYVPLWMTDNEAQFTNTVATSFIEFKGGIDQQYALGLPPNVGTAFPISSQGVPLIAQPTEGTLSFVPQTCPNGFNLTGRGAGQPVSSSFCVFENQTMSVGPGGSGVYSQELASGVLQEQLPNRYYSAENFYFEDDGVVQSQSQGYQVMAFPPPFNVTTVAGNTTLTSSFLALLGNATSVIGQGSEEVYSHLTFSQEVTSNGKRTSATNPNLRPFNYTFEIGTQYPCAWSTYLQNAMTTSGLSFVTTPTWGVASFNYSNPLTHVKTIPYTGSCNNPSGYTTILAVNVNSIQFANLFYAGVEVTIGIGSS